MVKFIANRPRALGSRFSWKPSFALKAKRSLNRSILKTKGRMSRARRSKLYTTTRKSKGPKIKRDGPVSESFVTIPYRKQFRMGKLKKILGEQVMVNNDVARLGHSSNQQATTVLPGAFNALDVSNIFAQAAGIVTSSGTNVNWKLELEQVNQHLMITNQTNDVVRITLYDCKPRRDIVNNSYTPPNNAWVNGDATAAGGTNAYSYVGSTPFQTPAFTKLYKVYKVTTLDLHTGGHHIHRMVGRPCYIMDKNTQVELGTSSNFGFKDLTAFTMIVQHGYPINQAGATTTINLASGAVDYVMTRQYKFRVLESSVASLSQVTSNLSANFAPTQAALLNDLTGITQTILTV